MEKEFKPTKTTKEEGTTAVKTKKYSYDELNNICNQLYVQNQNLLHQIKQIDQFSVFKRIEFLFKAVELSDKINDAEFVCYCVNELKETLVIPAENKSSKEE